MPLTSIFKTMKNEGYVIKPLDQYLLSLNSKDEENDRAIDVNAPSAIGGCLRARYYSRMQIEKDGNSVDPRSRRIFDNGTYYHIRLQSYLMKQGILLLDEVPLRNDTYNIQGHTDGYLQISPIEIAILELKSINDKGFSELKDAQEHHKKQGCTYMFCAEQRRLDLQMSYSTQAQFDKSLKARQKYYASLYQHLKDGSKHTREEKIAYQVSLHEKSDAILFKTKRPVNKTIFLYENKNDQNLKEYVVEQRDEIIEPILDDCVYLNKCVKTKKCPPRCTGNKSDCRFCDYKVECWN